MTGEALYLGRWLQWRWLLVRIPSVAVVVVTPRVTVTVVRVMEIIEVVWIVVLVTMSGPLRKIT